MCPLETEYERSFVVMGTTGNVYTVKIGNKSNCTCMDFRIRQRNCKHLYFILMKVMRIEEICHKIHYNDDELIEMFGNIPEVLSANLVINDTLKTKYEKKIGKTNEEKEIIVSSRSKDDNCPICLEELKNGNSLDFCKFGCGKYIHSLCFSMWAKKNSSMCVFCRKPWKKVSNKKRRKKLINLIH